MNNALSRLLLACLLAVALPLKGLAASSMLACGPNHHADAATVAHAHGATAPAHTHALEHATAATPAHGHEHGVATTAPSPHGQGHQHEHRDGAAHDPAAVQDAGSGAEPPASQSGSAPAADQAPDLKVSSKCGTCAPCCVSAALTGDQTHHIAQAANGADFPAFAAGHPSPPAGRLDRPPRDFLA